MKPPDWLSVTSDYRPDATGHITATVRVRWWHPGAWRWLWGALPVPGLLKPLALVYVLGRGCRGRLP